ncbi:TrkA C-terminal domain-containing protein [Streptococcus dentapri]|uniref:TrkA C-terminal domain-containing protein n=1 Tax=Streptococcus dentapri TaxID=573564 RepID=A0ABV8CYG6_9STRE
MAELISKTKQSRYQQVAVGIAKRIVEGKYLVGEKMKSRSTLASNFNVSPETARKAINILVDLDIVEVRHGSGVRVVSKEKAKEFLETFEATHSLNVLKSEIHSNINQQESELRQLSRLIDDLISQNRLLTKRFPFDMYEYLIEQDSSYFGKELGDLKFWKETGATIIAIEHEEKLIVSPGPHARIERGDRIYFVGDSLSYANVQEFFNK